MGYTHYWYREKEIKQETFNKIVDDFRKLLPVFARNDTPLAGGDGEGYPLIDSDIINFNGAVHCGHPTNKELVIPWPEKTAGGLGNNPKAISGEWFAGAKIEARMCNGDCSYESVLFERLITDGEPQEKIRYYKEHGEPVYNEPRKVGKYFNCCKTAFRPYDWAVTAFLIVVKHYLGDTILVHSDGDLPNWQDGMILCQLELGYGMDFKLDD